VHVVQGVPLLYRLLIEAAAGSGQAFPEVEHVIVTGDSLPMRYLSELPHLFPHASFYNLYGCTETNDSFIHEILSSDFSAGVSVPIGRPLPGVSALVIDEDGCPLEGPGTGELWVATPFQTKGYLDPALNEGKFVTRDDGACPRLYFRTGDVVRRHDDGVTTLESRQDFYVKVRGVRVNTQEVEQVILQHDDVLEAAVIAVPDETAGRRLHAIVRRRTVEFNSLMLRRHCADRLPRPAIPSTIEITDRPLPATTTGKVDRTRIRTMNKGESLNGLH
jgi:acyl-coenzyme A synthetase/AMP-(fatty) acid ligase